VYELLTGVTVQPASPERLFIQWMAQIVLHERVRENYIGNQNLPSRAEGENLDNLGEIFYASTRPEATASTCTMRFTISQAQSFAVLIPAGTRVTDASGVLFWETEEDVYFHIGETTVEVKVRCQTPGTAGNGYVAGQISTLVDVFPYYLSCENVTASDGGGDRASDDEFYELMRLSMDAYSCAGPMGGYIYFAKRVSTEITDVVPTSPEGGVVKLYVLTQGGTPASEELKGAVLEACSAETVRPMTDHVFVEDPRQVTYDIAFTYYTQSGGDIAAAEIVEKVQGAVEQYAAWQCAKLGRDINPSRLISMLMEAGIKRVELRAPAFTDLDDGQKGGVPEVARLGQVSIVNGGYEDE
jgi:phage-related baseplate assembly protein